MQLPTVKPQLQFVYCTSGSGLRIELILAATATSVNAVPDQSPELCHAESWLSVERKGHVLTWHRAKRTGSPTLCLPQM